MKTIKFNYNKDIVYDRTVNKVRAIVLNKEGKALIEKYAGLYMLPGGSIDDGETELMALKREIQEEAGIEINLETTEKFLQINSFDENYYDRKEKKEINRITNTSFYFVETDKEIDFDKRQLTQSEKENGHTIKFENLSRIPYLVQTNETNNKKREQFDREILTVLKEFTKYRDEKQKEEIR